jgi:hypothetical protein
VVATTVISSLKRAPSCRNNPDRTQRLDKASEQGGKIQWNEHGREILTQRGGPVVDSRFGPAWGRPGWWLLEIGCVAWARWFVAVCHE